MALSLDTVPQELFSKITYFLTEHDTYEGRQSLGALRLAGNRALAERVAPVLLSTVGFWLSQESLAGLCDLCEHQKK